MDVRIKPHPEEIDTPGPIHTVRSRSLTPMQRTNTRARAASSRLDAAARRHSRRNERALDVLRPASVRRTVETNQYGAISGRMRPSVLAATGAGPVRQPFNYYRPYN